jgi:hypothetical protein
MSKIKPQNKNTFNRIIEKPSMLEKPAFSFSYLTNDKKYNLEGCTKEEKVSLITKISKIAQRTWNQLKTEDGKHALGYELLERSALGDKANGIPYEFKIVVFRFHGKKPMIGYRCSQGIFHIVYLDRDFTLYKH